METQAQTVDGSVELDATAHLNELDARISGVQVAIDELIDSTDSEFVRSFTGAHLVQERLRSLHADVATLRKAQASGTDGDVGSAISRGLNDAKELDARIAASSNALRSLDQLCKLNELLGSFDSALSRSDYETAAQQLVQMQEVLARGSDTTINAQKSSQQESPMFRLVRIEFRKRGAALSARLSALLRRSLVFEGEGRCLRVHRRVEDSDSGDRADSICVSKLLTALRVLNVVRGALPSASSSPLQLFVAQLRSLTGLLLTSPQAEATIQTPSTDTTGGRAASRECAVFVLQPESGEAQQKDTDGNAPSVALVCRRLGALVAFLHDEVAATNTTIMKELGAVLWCGDRGLARMLQQLLLRTLPSSRDQLQEWASDAREATATLETRLCRLGFLRGVTQPAPNGSNGISDFGDRLLNMSDTHVPLSLATFLTDVDALFAQKQREHTLQRARALLASEYHNSIGAEEIMKELQAFKYSQVEKAGDNKGSSESGMAFQLDCQVTASASRLVRMAHETLAQIDVRTHDDTTGGTSPKCAAILWQTARDLLNLFRAMVPTAHAEVLATDTRLAALFYNDCVFLAQSALTLGHTLHDALPALLQRSESMVDLVPPLRQLGMRHLAAQLERQETALRQQLQRVPPLASTIDDAAYHCIDLSLRQILHMLRRTARTWREVLPQRVAAALTGKLFDLVLTELWRAVSALQHMAADTTQQLHELMGMFVDAAMGSSGDGGLFASLLEADENTRSLSKFRLLRELLNDTMSVLAEKHAAGCFHEFATGELAHFICAIFEDNTKRRALLEQVST